LPNDVPSKLMRSPQSPGASSVVKVRNCAPLQQSPPTVLDVVDDVDVVEELVAPGTVEDVDDVVAPGRVVSVLDVVELVDEEVVGPGTEVVVDPPGQTTGAGARVAMKRPGSLRRIRPPNWAQ
jgi:hypothetical protein